MFLVSLGPTSLHRNFPQVRSGDLQILPGPRLAWQKYRSVWSTQHTPKWKKSLRWYLWPDNDRPDWRSAQSCCRSALGWRWIPWTLFCFSYGRVLSDDGRTKLADQEGEAHYCQCGAYLDISDVCTRWSVCQRGVWPARPSRCCCLAGSQNPRHSSVVVRLDRESHTTG